MCKMKKHNTRKSMEIPLKLECYDDELSPAQVAAYNKAEYEFSDALKKIESLIKKTNGNIVDQNDSTTIINVPTGIGSQLQQPVTISTGGSPIITNASIVKSKVVPTSVAGLPVTSTLKTATTASLVALQNPQGASSIVSTANIQQGGTYQLVMDPRLGLLVSPVPQATTPATSIQVPLSSSAPSVQTTTTTVMKSSNSPQTVLAGQRRTYPGTIQPKTTTGKVLISYNTPQPSFTTLKQQKLTPPPQKLTPSQQKLTPSQQKLTPSQQKLTPSQQKLTPPQQKLTPPPPQNVQTQQKNKPNAAVIDLTDDEGRGCASDSREINFNNLSGKTFPSLVVVARPHMRMKDMNQAAINEDRKYFNDRVKGVLMFTPTKFTEWLIQQGLVRSEHYCTTHTATGTSTAVKLKLGMYSDLSKFPYSGGYVWISECCPQRFVSVFSGSIFEGAPYAPTVLLKLLYHWCSQTSVQNVVQWVKVEKLYVKTFYTNLRAVCTATICEKFEKLGGPDKRIEVGVISLGTTSSDGSMRQVKVEVLGVMDPEKKIIRLRAIEPLLDGERNVKKRFVKILEPLEQWIHKETTILTDNTVDKSTLHTMGYKNVFQVSINDTTSPSYRNSNYHVMEYLRRVVPRMFQNTLSLLSRQIIQQFLDELVWRERWGHIPSRAFEAIISHIAEQTKIDSGETLTARLTKVSANPFRNWTYSLWLPLNPPSVRAPVPSRGPSSESAKRGKRKFTSTPRNAIVSSTPATPSPTQKSQPTATAGSPELTSLESYYYGTIKGDTDLSDKEAKCKLNMKCCSCRSVLPTNIHMMKHIIGHAFDGDGFVTDYNKVPHCRYCLKTFASDFCLQSHLEEVHFKTGTNLRCLICEEKFTDRTTLILHMHRNHIELELPYECNICGFRTSEHRLVVDHFYEKHNEGEKVQCPFCLKTVAFSNNGRKVTQNLYFFLRHMQKHTRKTIARKCTKCTLSFVHKGILKEHQTKHHSTCKGMESIERCTSTGLDTIIMPKPLTVGPLAEKHQILKTQESLISNNFTANKFETPIIYDEVPDGGMCCECEGDITGEDHFQGFLSCMRCRFATCCTKAMNEHNIIFHDPKSKEFNVGKMIILVKPMHCVCGFKSTSGNKLAKHLALCGRKSAYPSAARAAQCTLQSQSASFPPLVTLDDQEDAEADPSDKWLQAFVSRKEKEKEDHVDSEKDKIEKSVSGDPPSMLNILGLVRKHSLDESSLDKPTSDLENSPQDVSELEQKVVLDIQPTEMDDDTEKESNLADVKYSVNRSNDVEKSSDDHIEPMDVDSVSEIAVEKMEII